MSAKFDECSFIIVFVSSAETNGAFHTGFDTVNLHRPTGGRQGVSVGVVDGGGGGPFVDADTVFFPEGGGAGRHLVCVLSRECECERRRIVLKHIVVECFDLQCG